MKRWEKEVPALGVKFGGNAIVSIADDNKNIVLTFRDDLVVLTATYHDKYPFEPPSVEIAGVDNSYINIWSPAIFLIDYINMLLDDVRTAKNNADFCEGTPYIGKNFALQQKQE